MSERLTSASTFGEVVKASQDNNINIRIWPEAYRHVKVTFFCPARNLAAAIQAIIDTDPMDTQKGGAQ